VHFSEDHISVPRECCAPKFLHALENHQVLLAHPSLGTGAPLTTFFKGVLKIGLKCNKGALITSKLGGVAQQNFGTWRGSRLGCWRKYEIWGHCPLKIWEGKKRRKFSMFYDNFRVWPRISLKTMKIATESKRRWREGSFEHWTKKILWNSVHYEQSYRRSCWPTLSHIFRKTIFRPLEGAAPSNFYTR